jgi:VWFA-related protein
MIKLFKVMTVLILALSAVPSVSPAAFYPGEGYVTPGPKSIEPFFGMQTRGGGTSGEELVDVSVVSRAFPDIVLNVTVRDSEGNPVTGLTAGDFTVTEQSESEAEPVVETPTCFEETQSESAIAFSLVFDVSQSMELENRLPDAKAAAIDFLDTTLPEDRGALVSFSGCDQTEIVLPLTGVGTDTDSDGTTDFAEAIRSLATINLTAVFDGIAAGIDSIREAPFPKGVIAFSDGNTNNDCVYTINEVIRKARDEGIPVYTVGLETTPIGDMARRLQQIADQTGGFYTSAPTASDMADIYRDIARVIRSQYRICYTTHNPLQDGTARTVKVTTRDGRTGTGMYTVGTGPVPENAPPIIDHTPVNAASAFMPISINARVTDPDGNLDRVFLCYRGIGPETSDAYTPVSMSLDGDGNVFRAEIPSNAVQPPGLEYYITAVDTLEAEARTDTFHVTVEDTPAPVADFTWTPENPRAGDPVRFVDRSSAIAAPIVSRNWTFGELGTATGDNPVFTFPDSGTYAVALRVTDEDGSTGTATRTVTVTEPPCVEGDCGGGSGGCFIDTVRSDSGPTVWKRFFRTVNPCADIPSDRP